MVQIVQKKGEGQETGGRRHRAKDLLSFPDIWVFRDLYGDQQAALVP
ncbi:hypothetical protein N836_04490 [Leptolyngbya sp. Heron Island J]|nr:hypothetical protein [Leptolyngbya sp. Heron Island J]ESA37072.1 hypothetical protein N836_04490 [Leptolyngbya sp. Heron Island J]